MGSVGKAGEFFGPPDELPVGVEIGNSIFAHDPTVKGRTVRGKGQIMTSTASILKIIALAKARLAKVNRWPTGSPGGKGGQFAPSKAGGGGGAAWGSAAHPGMKNPSAFDVAAGGVHPWGGGPKKAPPPGAVPHPKVDEKGAPVLVHYPTKAGDQEHWGDKAAVATAVPGGALPRELNGVPFKRWAPPEDWTKVSGTDPRLDADPMHVPADKRAGAGVIILEPDGRMWLTKPTNEFGGYVHSWPKGGVETGLSLQQTAIKEAYEETGLKVKLTGVLGDYEGDTSVARYFVARRVGGTPADMGWESQAMRLVPANKLKSLLNRSRDKEIADDITHLMRSEGIVKGLAQTLYVRRDLLNADTFIAWAKQNGFPTTQQPGDLHVTLAYSRKPLDWSQIEPDPNPLTVEPSKDRSVKAIGEEGRAVVLMFTDDTLEARWRELVDLGAEWKWPGFIPHVTISWNGAGVDLSKVAPFVGALEFGPEVFRAIDEDWQSSHFEKAKGPATGAAHTGMDKQPRWPAGSPLGGQWKAYDGAGFAMPPKLAGGLESKNPQYQKQANALYSAVKAGDTETAKAAVDALAGKLAGYAEKGQKSSHVKWSQQVHQYGADLLATLPKAAQAEAATDKVRGPAKLSDMTKVGPKPGGTAPGALYSDKGGEAWLVKGSLHGGQAHSDDRARNEVLASHLLNAAGVGAPTMKLVDLGAEHGGGLGVASKWISGTQKFSAKNADHLSAAQHQFAIHAWLGNWDAIGAGYDNTVIKNGKALCIDPGGSLLFRAQGAPKKAGEFGAAVHELKTMRDPAANPQAAAVYGKMTAHQLIASAKALEAIDEPTIKKLVDAYGPGNASEKAKLADTLIARRKNILDFGEGLAAGLKIAEAGGSSKDIKAAVGVSPKAPAAPPPALMVKPKSDVFAASSHIAAPKFVSGFQTVDELFTGSASLAAFLHGKAVTGDKQAFDSLIVMKYGLPKGMLLTTKGIAKVKANMAPAKKMQGYVDALLADATPKYQAASSKAFAEEAKAEQDKHDAAKAAADAKVKAVKPALPSFEAALLPPTNTNAGSHNKKVQAIAAAAQKGDVAALEAMKFGTNTYGKKQAQLANDALAALGSSYTHQIGAPAAPKPMRGAAATVPLPPPPPPPAAPESSPVPVVRIPKRPDFNNWHGPGKALSSVSHVNAQNDALAKLIHDTAQALSIEALSKLTYSEIDKATGAPTGAVKPLAEHPSQHVKAYLKDAIDAIKNPYVPPKKMSAAELAAIPQVVKSILDAVKPADVKELGDAAKRIGRYAVLGQIDGKPFDGFPPEVKSAKIGNLDVKALYDGSKAGFAKLTATERQAVKDYTGSGYQSQNNAETGKGNTAATNTIAALKKASIELPEGTVLSRKFSFKTDHHQNVAELMKQVGGVIKDFGIISTSTNPSTWAGDVHLRIETAKGVKGLYVAPDPAGGGAAISKHPGENEIILPHGTKFYVKSVSQGKKVKDKTGSWAEHSTYLVHLIALPNVD